MELAKIKELLRRGMYSWPGWYPMYFRMADGEAMSFQAVEDNWREIVRAHLRNETHSDWYIVDYDINWENTELYCAQTNERIESAYGEP